jgi:ATP-grasp domain, R2K clade family 3
MLLVPSDVLRARRVDEHFAPEADAARAAGQVVGLVDHDALARGDAAAAVARVPDGDVAVYRGWMLSSEQYAGFAAALAERGVRLRTGAEEYRRAHELPGWYAALSEFTPASVWDADFEAARTAFGAGPAILRDFSKSMKHYWHEACYIPDVGDAAAAGAVARRMRELRGDDFTGGYVLRRFESFVGAEARTWWVDGECRLITAHPDSSGQEKAADVTPLRAAVAGLGLPFVTVDLARRDDGQWRVVELGDGQVSDRPASTPPEELIGVLFGRG